jgi:hypothetical protein
MVYCLLMPNYRCQIAQRKLGGLAIDDIVNTIHLRDSGPTTDPANLASSLTAIWANLNIRPSAERFVECKIYDLAHAMPRVAVATHLRDQAGTGGTGGPREVALCLSFYSGQNQAGKRGRIFVGPFQSGVMLERPSDSVRNTVQALATSIAAVGGIDVDWCVYSPKKDLTGTTDSAMQPVSNSWTDNEWDTMRSRGLKATNRATATHDEDPA